MVDLLKKSAQQWRLDWTEAVNILFYPKLKVTIQSQKSSFCKDSNKKWTLSLVLR